MRLSRILFALVLSVLAACSEGSTEAHVEEVGSSARVDASVDSVAAGVSGATRGGNTMGSGN